LKTSLPIVSPFLKDAEMKTGQKIAHDTGSDMSHFDRTALQTMRDAGAMVLECRRVLGNAQQNVVSDLIRFTDDFKEWNHLPENDVHDHQSHSQYYYHTHSKLDDPGYTHNAEHGHFHTFLRANGVPKDIKPAPLDPHTDSRAETDPVSHIVGIGMDGYGVPVNLFTTNRWVTKETWYKAQDVIRLLDLYEIDHAWPSWPVNLWVTNMLRLFRPQIETLLMLRDRKIEEWHLRHPGRDIFEDRELEVTSSCSINIEEQIAAIKQALNVRHSRKSTTP